MADENNEEKKGFTVTDRRFSSQSEDEKKSSDADKEELRTIEAEKVKKDDSQLKIDFSSFVLSLSTSALIQLGKINDPITKKADKNLEAAKQTIDILSLMQQKTKGNLTREEQSVMDSSLYDLRMMFIDENK
jgi:hypothetical protein